jgi:hypothetical protein
MKVPDTPTSDDRSSKYPTRKAYQKPQLQVYGDLTEITESVMGSIGADGAGHPNKHFTS